MIAKYKFEHIGNIILFKELKENILWKVEFRGKRGNITAKIYKDAKLVASHFPKGSSSTRSSALSFIKMYLKGELKK